MARIELRGVSKRYGSVEALRQLDLDIADGEFLVLAGPSGCGKTTLLRIIAGLTEPSSGSLYIDEQEVTQLPPGSRQLAMVFQNYALFPHMTVERNLSFGLRLRRVSAKDRDAQVAETARLLRMEELLGRYPRELSGGQKQRVALGRALIRRPAAFLFDEPLSNLDAALRTEMRAEILHLRQAFPITTIYVTHDQTEAMTMGSRLVVMNEGCIKQMGAPLDVYNDPADSFTAGFLGSPSANMIQGRIEADGAAPGFVAPDGLRFSLRMGEVPPAALGRDVLLCFRAERCEVMAAGTPSAIDAEVALCEETGRERIVHLTRGALKLRCAQHAPSGPAPAVGERAALLALPGSLMCFDADTGGRIR